MSKNFVPVSFALATLAFLILPPVFLMPKYQKLEEPWEHFSD
jgi:hypothetical protein